MRTRLTYANVISTLALIAVIAGGTAVALPGKNSVQANDLKKNAVKARAIAAGAVRAAEIKDGSVGSAEVADGSVAYGELASNSVVARIRTTAAVDTGNATNLAPKPMPVSGNTWTQAAGEMDIFFGEFTYTRTGPCTTGGMLVQVKIDGQLINDGFAGYVFDPQPGTHTHTFLISRPWLPEAANATPRTATVEISDDCTAAGETIRVDSVKVNAVAVR